MFNVYTVTFTPALERAERRQASNERRGYWTLRCGTCGDDAPNGVTRERWAANGCTCDACRWEPVVGEGVTLCGYSDRHAFTIVSVSKSGKSFKAQRDTAKLQNGAASGAPDALHFSPGGFVGHTSGTQRWEYAPNPEGQIVTIRRVMRGAHKLTPRWQKDRVTRCIPGRSEHYDFNF